MESVLALLGGTSSCSSSDGNSAEIGVLADELLHAIIVPLPFCERAVRVGCSGGLVLLRDRPRRLMLLREVVTAADRAMYEAKLV